MICESFLIIVIILFGNLCFYYIFWIGCWQFLNPLILISLKKIYFFFYGLVRISEVWYKKILYNQQQKYFFIFIVIFVIIFFICAVLCVFWQIFMYHWRIFIWQKIIARNLTYQKKSSIWIFNIVGIFILPWLIWMP